MLREKRAGVCKGDLTHPMGSGREVTAKFPEFSHTQKARKWSDRKARKGSSMDVMTSGLFETLHKITMPIFTWVISWFQRSGIKGTRFFSTDV